MTHCHILIIWIVFSEGDHIYFVNYEEEKHLTISFNINHLHVNSQLRFCVVFMFKKSIFKNTVHRQLEDRDPADHYLIWQCN